MRCTLIIPTYNRPEQLRCQLAYCAQAHRQLSIRVADGSLGEAATANEKIVLASGHPDVLWKHFPGTHLWQRAVALLHECPSPYAMLCGDDDFLVPDGASMVMNFLDSHPGYASAQGITIGLPGISAGGTVSWHLNSLLGSLDMESPGERAAHHLAAYSHTCYAIHRTAVLRESLHFASSPPFSMATICLGELAQSIHTVLAGKTAWLNVPGLCRSPSSSRWPASMELMRPEFSSCVAAIRDLVVKQAADEPVEALKKLLDTALSASLSGSRTALTSSTYDFWVWRSPRVSPLAKPDLHAALIKLKQDSGWPALTAEYPAAARARIKKRRLKSWLRILLRRKA